jgi:hypothetical protein
MSAGKLAQGHLGTTGVTVHKYAAVYGDQEIAFPALSQRQETCWGGNTLNGLPGLCHAWSPF